MKNGSFVLHFLFSFLSILIFFAAATAKSVTVRTKYGDIQGTVTDAPPMAGSAITKVNTFLGIPFAVPPVGELRFNPPKPAKAWKPSVYDATRFKKVCLQKQEWFEEVFKQVISNFGKSNYSEDCLYLNVYAPAQNDSLNPSTKYPVMFYIHGGGFVGGSGIISVGNVLPTYGVVLVTIQYRLGPFGFLSTADSAGPGNYGMLDQVLALKWVKENIDNFGGDPDKVTIFGLSAGGASVGLHLLSPLSASLFHGAISESGVDLSPWAFATTQVAKNRTVQLAKKTACEYEELDKLVECLRKKDAWDIISSGGDVWAPVVDGVEGGDAFLPDTPQILRRAGKFRKVPYMVGFVPNEGAYFVPQLENMTADLTHFKTLINTYGIEGLHATEDKQLINMFQQALEFQYTPWGETADPLNLRQGIVDTMGDRMFVAPSVQVCEEHSTHAQTYMFLFNYRSQSSQSARWMGATHGDNFIFDFGFAFLGLPLYNDVDRNVSNLVMTMYTNFAKLGNPTPDPLSNGVQWTAFNSTNLAYLRIQPDPEMKSNIHPHRMAFWNEYHPQLVKSARACDNDQNKVSGCIRASSSFTAMTSLFVVAVCALFLL